MRPVRAGETPAGRRPALAARASSDRRPGPHRAGPPVGDAALSRRLARRCWNPHSRCKPLISGFELNCAGNNESATLSFRRRCGGSAGSIARRPGEARFRPAADACAARCPTCLSAIRLYRREFDPWAPRRRQARTALGRSSRARRPRARAPTPRASLPAAVQACQEYAAVAHWRGNRRPSRECRFAVSSPLRTSAECCLYGGSFESYIHSDAGGGDSAGGYDVRRRGKRIARMPS